MKGSLNTRLKDRYTLIEQSDLNTLIEQSQYSSKCVALKKAMVKKDMKSKVAAKKWL